MCVSVCGGIDVEVLIRGKALISMLLIDTTFKGHPIRSPIHVVPSMLIYMYMYMPVDWCS